MDLARETARTVNQVVGPCTIARPRERLPYMPALSSSSSYHVRSSLSQTLPNLISTKANSILALAGL